MKREIYGNSIIATIFEEAEIKKDELRKSRKKKQYDTIPVAYIAGQDYNR